MSSLPTHVAVIMDGNGRWAKQRHLDRRHGHRAGADAVRTLVRGCRERGIPFVTVYAFSKENWQRPVTEVSYLFELFADFIRQETHELIRQGIRLDMIGEQSDLPFATRKILEYAMQRTAQGKDMCLTLALSYSGREEILRAVRKLMQSGLSPHEVDETQFRSYLYKPDLPDPDLIIRTSGEMRLSNFLLFESAYAELYFTPKLWPDFSTEDLEEALRSFAERERRFGLTAAVIPQRGITDGDSNNTDEQSQPL